MEPDAANNSMPDEETPKPVNFFSRLGGVYASPRKTFNDIGRAPDIWIPLIILLVIGLLVGFYMSGKMDFESMMVDQLEAAVAQGRMTQEQMDQQLPLMLKFAGIQTILGTPLGWLLVVFAIAGYAKLFSVLSGSESRFKSLLSVTTYVVMAISIVQSALMVLILQLKGQAEISVARMSSIVASNLGAIITGILGEDALPKFVATLASFVDVFAIWTIALLAIGYSVVSKKLKTGTAAVWLVVTYAIIAIAAAALVSSGAGIPGAA